MTAATARAPFLDFNSFTVEDRQEPLAVRETPPMRSPFISIYELEEGQSTDNDPVREAYVSLVNELRDEEFEDALFEVQNRARILHDDHLATGASRADAERLVMRYVAPLISEAEAMVDAMANQIGPRESGGITDQEIDSFLDEYKPAGTIEPEFERWLGGWAKKLKRLGKAAVGAAWKGIKQIGFMPILKLIKPLIGPWIKSIIQRVIGYLPAAIQPLAQTLAEKLGFPPAQPPAAAADAASASTTPDGAGSPVQAVMGDSAAMQQELDQQLVASLLAQDEAELNLEVAQFQSNASTQLTPAYAELDDARERFIQELRDLKEGESAAPLIQNFVPIMLAARTAIGLAGRPRVIGWLTDFVNMFVSRLLDKQQSPALSKAIVEAGMKLLNLEMSEAEQSGLGASAVAATVEETVNRVASLPEYVLDNQEMLEGFALEAFEQAAAANLPAIFSSETYRQRPDLLEAGVNAGWLLMPLSRRKRYKRCSRIFNVRLTPHMAQEIESFEGVALSEVLQDQFGMEPGYEVDAQVHLYETLPGTTIADIAHGENEVLGAGMADEMNATQLHPLTPQAAAVLLGKPGLGRNMPAAADSRNLAAGQRLFHVAIAGKRPLPAGGHHGHRRPHGRRLLHLNATLDVARDQIHVCVFISEVKAQRLAVLLRQASNTGSIVVGFQRSVAHRLGRIFRGHAARRLHVVYSGMRPGHVTAQALRNLPASVSDALIARMQEWLTRGFAALVKTQAQSLLAAADDPSDGITLQFTIEHPPGLKAFCQALADHKIAGSSVAAAIAGGDRPNVRVNVVAGHRCG